MYNRFKISRIFLTLGLLGMLALGCGEKNHPDNTLPTDLRQGATKATKDSLDNYLTLLDFTSKGDLDNANFGFRGTLPEGQRKIIDEATGKVVFDLDQYKFIPEDAVSGNYPETVNPSLWRQSHLNQIHGLFELKKDFVYQIRGFDLANMTLVYNQDGGWIVIDPLGSPPTAKAALKLFRDITKRTEPVTDVIFTHSHIDHFGGIKGIATEEELPDIDIYAPQGFFEESVSENIMAGNCMGRRAAYMYGNILPKDEKGTVGTGLGTTTSSGIAGIVEEEIIISSLEPVEMTIGKLKVEFMYTPSSEAPAEMMFYFSDYQAFCQAEDMNHTLHNLYTLRGAKVRNGQKWSKYIDKAIANWSDNVEISFGSHHWPTIGRENIVPFWEKQRDMYRFIHDQTLRLANQGYTSRELADTIKLPTNLDTAFCNRGYYGSVSHDVKAQYQLYFGWFDGNPANLNPLPPVQAGKKYVDLMGTKEALYEAGNTAYIAGEYRWAAELLNHLVFAQPDYEEAKHLLANTYEQMGYQAESGPWRNFYLTGAKELRRGIIEAETPETAGPDMIAGMTNELYFDFLAMKFKGTDPGAADLNFKFNLTLPDMAAPENLVTLIVSNGAVTPRIGSHVAEPTGEVRVNRGSLDSLSILGLNYDDLVESGKITFDSPDTQTDFGNFMDKIDSFKFWFPIVTP